MKLFLPRYYVAGYDHVSVDRLKENGIRLLLCDIDNTLVSAFEPDPNEKVIRFIRQIEAAGIKVAVCSNSTRKRTLRFSEDLGIQKAYYFSFKPLPYNFIRAMHHYHVEPGQTALLGDQIFTDIIGGNAAGLYTILTNPVTVKDKTSTRMMRFFEKYVFIGLEKKYNFRKGVFDD